jgi:hypothetical protein
MVYHMTSRLFVCDAQFEKTDYKRVTGSTVPSERHSSVRIKSPSDEQVHEIESAHFFVSTHVVLSRLPLTLFNILSV